MPRPPEPAAGNPKVYFAFPDRVYHFECASCDALCCRGHGIGTSARETPALLSRYPELAWATTKHGPTGSNFTNPGGGCYFLTADNLCRVERDHGREAKPGVCVAFPFNNYSRLGDVLVVRPHFLCPLRLNPGRGAGHHAELERQLLETGLLPRALAQPGPALPLERARELVRREVRFRDRCGEAIGRAGFGELLERETPDIGEFREWRERALRLWGLPAPAAPRDSLDDILLAVAPALRIRAVRLPERQHLRILSLGEAYLRSLARVAERPFTLQGAHQLIQSVHGVLRFFAYGNIRLPLPEPEAEKGVEFQNPALTLAFFQALEELRAGEKLFDALERALPERVSNIERAIFFHQLAVRVRELKRDRRPDA